MSDDDHERGLRSGELARRVGLSVDTLHHYEQKGVLPEPPRTANGYREYPREAIDRVLAIQAALGIGFTLDELAEVFRARAEGSPPCRQVRDMAADKLAAAEERMAELARLIDTLRAQIANWDARLADVTDGRPARLLEHLAASRPARRRPSRSQPPRPISKRSPER